MELQYYGANCLRLTTKKAQIVIDDNLEKLGLKTVTKPTDISLRSHRDVPNHEARFMADMPGEYEISGAVIHGVAARAHMDEVGKNSAVVYTVEADGVKVGILGHIYPELSEDQLEQIGMVDILVVPIGGNGYTLDGIGALKVIKQIEPKIVIPVHYADKSINYEVSQAELTDALKNLGMETSETVDKYKYKAAELTDSTHLVVLNKV
jgi:L-ascorbate metabolism protein UlaG (beta-lactamase superfamily)